MTGHRQFACISNCIVYIPIFYFRVPYIAVVMVNFMSSGPHHGVPRLNIISRYVFEGVWICRFRKLNCPPQWGWAILNPLRNWIEQEAEEGRICRFSFLPAYLMWDTGPLLPMVWDLLDWFPCFSGLWTLTGITKLVSLGLQFVDGRSCDLSGSVITWANRSLYFI